MTDGKYQEVSLLYESQLASESESISNSSSIHQTPRFSSAWHLLLAYLVNIVLIILVAVLMLKGSKRCHDPSLGVLYSPAQEVIEYESRSFPESTRHKGPYQADQATGIPTDETDRLWDDLYKFGMQTWVNEETAKQLPNRTLAVPDLSDRYIIQLDVFHQLHCLDVIRGLLWPERYKHKSPSGYYLPSGERNYTSSAANHYDHCLEYLRQSVMCHSDISVVYYDYTSGDKSPSPHELEAHTCRNFQKIQNWARERQLGEITWPSEPAEWPNGHPPESWYSS